MAEIGRYALAAAIVLSFGVGAAVWIGHDPEGQVSSETDDAVLLDLPPALASSAPQSDVADGPEQQLTEAAIPASPPPPKAVAPPKPDVTPPPPKQEERTEEQKPSVDQKPKEPPPVPQPPLLPEPPPPPPPKTPLPEMSKPTPVVEKQLETPPPPVAAAPAQEETAPAGSQEPVKQAEPIDSEAARTRAVHAISRWQRAMLSRLEGAKNGARAGGLVGEVRLTFTIDRRGRLRSSRVARSSGSDRLDQAALGLLKRAAPFPDPPSDLSDQALTFTVPVVFAHRR